MNPHPSIRLACLAGLAVTVPWLEWPAIVLVLVLEGVVFMRLGGDAFARAARAVSRMRWLYLALLIGFVGFPPPGMGEGVSARLAGLGFAGRQVGMLVSMVLAVRMLFETTENDRLLAGLVGLLGPLRRLGVPVDRFARRLLMTMQAIDGIRTRAAELRRTEKPRGLSGAVAIVARLVEDIESGRTVPHVPETPRALPGIPGAQWLYPFALPAAMVLTGHLLMMV